MTADLRLHDGGQRASSGRRASRSRPSSSWPSWSPRCSPAPSAPPSCASTTVDLDAAARRPSSTRSRRSGVRIIAHRPDKRTERGVRQEGAAGARGPQPGPGRAGALPGGEPGRRLRVHARTSTCAACSVGRHRILRCTSPAIPNAIAALLLHIRDRTGADPPRLLRLDGGQPAHLRAALPGPGRGRHGARDARGAAQGHQEPAGAAAHPRRVSAPARALGAIAPAGPGRPRARAFTPAGQPPPARRAPARRPADAIVVLGSGMMPDGDALRRPRCGAPCTASGSTAGAWRRCSCCSGPAQQGPLVEAEVRAALARDLGVPAAADRGRGRGQDARATRRCACAALLRPPRRAPILLVTGAHHMPRARAVFEREGLSVSRRARGRGVAPLAARPRGAPGASRAAVAQEAVARALLPRGRGPLVTWTSPTTCSRPCGASAPPRLLAGWRRRGARARCCGRGASLRAAALGAALARSGARADRARLAVLSTSAAGLRRSCWRCARLTGDVRRRLLPEHRRHAARAVAGSRPAVLQWWHARAPCAC